MGGALDGVHVHMYVRKCMSLFCNGGIKGKLKCVCIVHTSSSLHVCNVQVMFVCVCVCVCVCVYYVCTCMYVCRYIGTGTYIK